MTIFTVMTALGTSLPLASRAFVPLFVVSLLSNPTIHRLCPSWLQGLCLHPPAGIAWIGNPYVLAGVALLAGLECLADKNDDLKELLHKSQVFLKTAVAVLVALSLLPQETQKLMPAAASAAGLGFGDYTTALLAAAATFFVASLRSRFYEAWFDADDEDDFGLRFLISLFEDLWALIAIPLFILLPTLTVLLVLALLALLAGGRWMLGHLEDRRRTDCAECGAEVLATASRCCGCRSKRKPRRILTWNLIADRSFTPEQCEWTPAIQLQHRMRLLAKRRCPACGERVRTENILQQGCQICGFSFEDAEWFEAYRSAVVSRAVRMLLPTLLISWIPVIGIAVAIVLTKVYLTAPLRLFLGHGRRFLLKWGMRILTAVLLVGGSLPLLSMAAVPILILVNILVYGYFAKRTITAKLSRNEYLPTET